MSNALERLTREGNLLGKKQYALWNENVFENLCNTSLSYFWERCDKDLAATENYLKLLMEGMGRGYITHIAQPQYADFYRQHFTWGSLLEYWLVLQIPLEVPGLPKSERLATMSSVWNLGENILKQPSWIDRYLLHKILATPTLFAGIEKQLEQWMEPVLRQPPVAQWKAPFDVTVFDGRKISGEFLPGEMRLSAPSIVCVSDRRLNTVFGGLFLNEDPCVLLSHHRHLGDYSGRDTRVEVSFGDSEVRIAGQVVALPHFGKMHSHLVCGQGIILATAKDSQRIWKIQCQ